MQMERGLELKYQNDEKNMRLKELPTSSTLQQKMMRGMAYKRATFAGEVLSRQYAASWEGLW